LFAALPQHAQQKVFQPAPYKTRKVILSTNIAETSVTVPGVRYVIDSGKMKIKQFRNRLGLDSLLVKPVSKSSAIQRKGRAGREAAGQCFRLYTEQDYTSLQKNTTPEILRCDLSDALLGMKARGVNNVLNFPFLDPPPREALEKSLLQLLQLGALKSNGDISEIGVQIAKLPLTPALGRVIVEAAKAENDCLSEIIDIISCLSVESIFINIMTEEKKEEAEEARKELARRDGDHLTLLATVKGYAAEKTDRKAWAQKYFVSHRALQNVMV
jgi:ATP-dependent RNA helicase DHR2